MRLDRFLKVSRLMKRRSVAKAMADGGRVLVNGKVAKPATPVKVGDEIAITTRQHVLRVEVAALRTSASIAGAREMVRVLSEEGGSEEE